MCWLPRLHAHSDSTRTCAPRHAGMRRRGSLRKAENAGPAFCATRAAVAGPIQPRGGADARPGASDVGLAARSLRSSSRLGLYSYGRYGHGLYSYGAQPPVVVSARSGGARLSVRRERRGFRRRRRRVSRLVWPIWVWPYMVTA